ncbi:hypothetical protein HAZT_HAZT009280 [Hyalella azteca]|uniref:Hermansky-Pudlak syndrome 1 protein homolog n=1 Tax=Hyalella azteca TaxID=294128 RepID=A0A6A0HC72_HYAAZ|nr:Hermansky-Pudlak syndrome 1 protein homolog [Hyalella azteca]KAA0202507.1 hypothetical protein HAZT_HAZT009280 [Hyalella azteca]
MLGILIFDQLNDIIYIKSDIGFLRHVQGMAVAQGLNSPSEINDLKKAVEANILVQLFSPLLTSHQVMDLQFGNPYTAITCHDGTTLAIHKYESCVFLVIGQAEEEWLQRLLSTVVRLTKLLVGPCVTVLRESKERRKVFGRLIKAWLHASASQQCYLVEAVERLVLSPEVTTAAVQVLSQVLDKMKSKQSRSSGGALLPCHALLLVRNKLLALYSSRSAQELSACDVLLLNLLLQENQDQSEASSLQLLLEDDCTLSPGSARTEGNSQLQEVEDEGSTLQTVTLEQLEGEEQQILEGVSCHSVLMLLKTELSVFTPHLVHYSVLHPNLALIVVSEIGRSRVSGSVMSLLQCVAGLSSGRGTHAVDVCEATLLQTLQLARKLTPNSNTDAIAHALDKVELQWHHCKTGGLLEWREGDQDVEMSSRLESALTALLDAVRVAWKLISLPYSPSTGGSLVAAACAQQAALYAKEKLASYAQFLDVKAMTNSKFECRALTVNKYMDDFPGLVHFIYVNRSTHELTAPSLDPLESETCDADGPSNQFLESCQATRQLTKERVWTMFEFARSHLSSGNFSVMWKDTTFSYAYFLWFEDRNGVAQIPEQLDEDVLAALPLPGILSEDFYRRLTAHCVPALSPDQVQVCEVLCVHLGLVTAPCILEQTRRLLASVWEVAGQGTSCHPADLL